MECLAVTYFHMRMHTIIGAASFHGSVRDGKRWVQSAMAAKRNLAMNITILTIFIIGKSKLDQIISTQNFTVF